MDANEPVAIFILDVDLIDLSQCCTHRATLEFIPEYIDADFLAGGPECLNGIGDTVRRIAVTERRPMTHLISNGLPQLRCVGYPVAAVLIEHETTGLLVPDDDSIKLVAAIERLIQDPGLAQRLGRNAREKAKKRFSMAAMTEQYEAFYQGIADPQ